MEEKTEAQWGIAHAQDNTSKWWSQDLNQKHGFHYLNPQHTHTHTPPQNGLPIVSEQKKKILEWVNDGEDEGMNERMRQLIQKAIREDG